MDAHHIEHWADGGKTELSNLVTLCRWHHRLVHEGGIGVQPRQGGGWRFFKANEEEFAPVRVDPVTYYLGTEIEETHEAQGLEITETTAATRWRGERMDYDHGVMLLCHKAERAAREESGVDAQSGAADGAAGTAADAAGGASAPEPAPVRVPAETSGRARRRADEGDTGERHLGDSRSRRHGPSGLSCAAPSGE